MASRGLLSVTNGDHEGLIFLSYSHTNHGFFFLLTIKYFILIEEKKHEKRLPENPQYAETRHGDVVLHYNDVKDRHAAV